MKRQNKLNKDQIPNQFDVSFKVLAEVSPLGIYLTDSTGTCFYVNQAWCSMSGLTFEEAVGDSWMKAIHSEDRDRIHSEWENFISGEIPWVSEYRFLDKKANIKWVHGVATLFKQRDGLVQGIIGININITEHKLIDLEVKQSQDWQEKIFEGSIDAIFISDEESRLVAVNKAACELTQYSKEQLLEMRIPDLHEYNDLEAYRKYHGRIFKGEKIISEAKILRSDGVKVDAEFTNSRILISGKLYMHTTARNITERRIAEEKIRNASLYARTLIEASLDPLVTINYEGKITDVNSSTEKITGMKRGKLIGSDFSDYFTEPDKAREGYRIVFSKGVVKDYPLRILHSSGRTIDVLYNATLFRNEDGKVQGVFAAARDITDQKKMEVELRKSKELLEKLNLHLQEIRENERSQIALNLHDDLGQRLTALYLDISWLKSRIGVQSLAVRKKMEEISQLINETIEGIKEFSSFLRPAILFDLGLVPAINEQLGKFKKQTGIICHFYCEPEEFAIDDRLALVLYRILQEALTNISRHAGASTTEIKLRVLKNTIVMLIKDDGIGIDKDKINSLTSMGIAGIKERLKSVYGRVLIEGEKGVGTIMKVLIPLRKREES